MMEKRYVYFVSFNHATGYGNAESKMHRMIENIDQIILWAKGLEELFGLEDDSIVILNYQLLRVEFIESNGE